MSMYGHCADGWTGRSRRGLHRRHVGIPGHQGGGRSRCRASLRESRPCRAPSSLPPLG
jgi:hypothetical protein